MRVEMNKNVTVESLEIELLKVKEELSKLKEVVGSREKNINESVENLPEK